MCVCVCVCVCVFVTVIRRAGVMARLAGRFGLPLGNFSVFSVCFCTVSSMFLLAWPLV